MTMEYDLELQLDKELFRFKTKEEFELEFGKEWKISISPIACWIDSMHPMLGITIPKRYNIDATKVLSGLWSRFSYSISKSGPSFSITKEMITSI